MQRLDLSFRYPVGATVHVFYDPSECSRSVLERGLTEWTWFEIAAVVCFIGVAVVRAFLMPESLRQFHEIGTTNHCTGRTLRYAPCAPVSSIVRRHQG